MTAIDIRRAREEDIPELTGIAVDSWHGAHENVLTGEALSAGPARLAAEIREGWDHIYIAETAGEIAGFFSLEPNASRIRHIYVRPDRHRQGIGSLMMAAAFDILRERGFQEATIEVIEGTGSDGFNRALGWREVGREPGGDGAVVISMRKAL